MAAKSRSAVVTKLTDKKPRGPTFAELLAAEARGVRPAPTARATPSARSPHNPVKVASRRKGKDLDAAPLDVTQSGERYEGMTSGTPSRVVQELKQGKHRPELTIDVHGLTSDQAVHMIEAVLQSAVESDLRTLLVVYGRGLHSPEGPVLPGVVVDYLSRVHSGSILALCSAPAKWGGPGALLVRLRRR